MIYKLLGTAAAEGIPALFCQCEVCERAWQAGGRNIRGRSGGIIGGHIMIDFPPDIFAYKIKYGLDLGNVEHIFFTHSHFDHLSAKDLCCYHTMYATRKNADTVLNLYGNEKVLQVIKEAFIFDMQHIPDCIKLHLLEPFKPVIIGDITFVPLLADHDHKEVCLLYLIEQSGKRIFVANDTTMLPEETFQYLKEKRLDVVLSDCTTGAFSCQHGHMGFLDNIILKERLIKQISADAETRFISNHFSHNGKINYDDFAELAGESGFISSYDGMEIYL